MNKRCINAINVKKDVDESYLSYRLKPCDGNTDKTKAYRLNSKDYQGIQQNNIMIILVIRMNESKINVELRYEYQIMQASMSTM